MVKLDGKPCPCVIVVGAGGGGILGSKDGSAPEPLAGVGGAAT